jgi:hypothetical protein
MCIDRLPGFVKGKRRLLDVKQRAQIAAALGTKTARIP